VLNLPGVFALLTRYAPAPRVASPPPQGKSVPTRRVRSGVRIIYAPARAQRAKHLRTRFLSIYLSRTRQESDSRRRLLSGTKSSVP
jgi:hypothetical protein